MGFKSLKINNDTLIDIKKLENEDELEKFISEEVSANDKIKKIDMLLFKKKSLKISKDLKRRL